MAEVILERAADAGAEVGSARADVTAAAGATVRGD
jgi:hypothetical protein